MEISQAMIGVSQENTQANHAKMYEIAKHLHENPEQKTEFAKDPEGFCFRFNGFVPVHGHHLHIADENNTLTPPEEEGVFGAEERTQWGRTEIRVGYKTTSLVDCA